MDWWGMFVMFVMANASACLSGVEGACRLRKYAGMLCTATECHRNAEVVAKQSDRALVLLDRVVPKVVMGTRADQGTQILDSLSNLHSAPSSSSSSQQGCDVDVPGIPEDCNLSFRWVRLQASRKGKQPESRGEPVKNRHQIFEDATHVISKCPK